MTCASCGGPLPPSKQPRKFCSKRCRHKAANAAVMARERTDPEFRAKRNGRLRTRYHADPEAARARIQRWREEHPEQQKAIERTNRERNGDKIRARNRAAYRADKERRNALRKENWVKARQNAPWHDIVRQARQRCIKKGLPFDLTDEWIKARWTGCCEVTGIPFRLSRGVRNFYSPSLDQIKPSKGYTQDNARFVLWAFNAFKNLGSDEDVYQTALAIVGSSTLLRVR